MELDELRDTGGFCEPRQWTQGIYEPIAQAVGGGWAAGRGLRALMTIAHHHPAARVVAASHGDIIPAFIVMLCTANDVPLPKVPDRGGWYTVRFSGGSFVIKTNGPEFAP
jgi:8-oxo-dGTP diphosphatase